MDNLYDYEIKKLMDLIREIFENSANVNDFMVENIGSEFSIRVINKTGDVVFGMRGCYKNLVYICKLILNNQKTNGGKLYEKQ